MPELLPLSYCIHAPANHEDSPITPALITCRAQLQHFRSFCIEAPTRVQLLGHRLRVALGLLLLAHKQEHTPSTRT